jgi:6-phosphogluconate dehydrogenase
VSFGTKTGGSCGVLGSRKGMNMATQQMGVIGLAVMGKNLALNIERCGYSVSVYNRSAEKTESFLKNEAQGKHFVGTYDIEEFVSSLEKPRKILLMVTQT